MKSSFHPVKYLLAVLLFLSCGKYLSAQTAGTPVVQNDFTGSGVINTQNLNATGTATVGSAVASGTMNNAGDTTIQVTGTYVGTLTIQVSQDGTNWFTDAGVINMATGNVTGTIPANSTGTYQVGVEGCRYMQVEASAWTSGSATVIFRVASTDSSVSLDSPIPAGTNSIGTVLAVGTTSIGNASSGNPVYVAGRVTSSLGSSVSSSGNLQQLPISGDLQVITHANGDPSNEWQATTGTTPYATATSTAVKAAGAAGVRNYVTDIHVINTSATVSTTFSILDGATVIWTTNLPAVSATQPQVVIDHTFATPLKGTAATAMNIQAGTTGASIYYNVGGFQNN